MQTDPVVLRPDQSLEEAGRRLERAGVSGGPVMSNGAVVGMLSLSDLFEACGIPLGRVATSGPWHRYERALAESEKTVADVMTHQVVAVHPEATIAEAASHMRTYRINRLPVVDQAGSLRGIVARDDIIDAVAKAVHELHSRRNHPGLPTMAPD